MPGVVPPRVQDFALLLVEPFLPSKAINFFFFLLNPHKIYNTEHLNSKQAINNRLLLPRSPYCLVLTVNEIER